MPFESLAQQIRSAFADTPSPGTAFDEISATSNDEGVVEYFRGTSWQDHAVSDLRYHSAALSFFTDAAYRYWLPAFMLAELEDAEEADIIAEHIAHDFLDTFRYWPALFSNPERRAIAAFLRHCEARNQDGVYDVLFRQAAEAVERVNCQEA